MARPPLGVVLFPGAGSDRNHASLVAIERRLAPLAVDRVDFPYRRAGRRAPDREPVLLDAVEASAQDMASRRRRVVVGGRSMGGRMASLALAAQRVPKAAGVVLIAFPLHPPGKPERSAQRAAHLGDIDVPVLVLHGTRDPFATPDELQAAFAAVPAPITWHWIDGGRHDLRGADDEIADSVRTFVSGLRG
jgi:uncharacterized protein